MKHTPTVEEVRDFYDDFMRSKMVAYRIHGNKRLDAAIERIKPLLKTNDRVLDVGCGIGIVAEALSRSVPEGFVLGIDLSPRNIWYAEQTARASNLAFAALDVVSEHSAIREKLGGLADVVVLVDVIEHIPEEDRPGLLQQLRALSSENAWLVMTYPSPQYQRYLAKHEPEALQIVDNVVELDQLLLETQQAGYHLSHYSYVDTGMTNQYCHAVFRAEIPLSLIHI